MKLNVSGLREHVRQVMSVQLIKQQGESGAGVYGPRLSLHAFPPREDKP